MLALATHAAASSSFEADFHALKGKIHTLPLSEAKDRLAELRDRALKLPPRPHQDKIDHFVVLLMENHAADNIFGCMDLPGFDGIPKEGLVLQKDATNKSAGNVTVTCGSASYVCTGGPHFDLYNLLFRKGSNMNTYPYDAQSLNNAYANGAIDGTTIEMFSRAQLPVKSAIADQFGVFNQLYSAVPSASQPNHMFVQSATSCGAATNELWPRCGGSTAQYPQMTIYDSMYVTAVKYYIFILLISYD